jgi:hypothetical protein
MQQIGVSGRNADTAEKSLLTPGKRRSAAARPDRRYGRSRHADRRRRMEKKERPGEYLYCGIAARPFERRFNSAEYV